jgi:RNA polymerase sigma factor FliA
MASEAAVYPVRTSRSATTSRRRIGRTARRARVMATTSSDALAARRREELTLRLMGLVRRVALEMRDRLPAHVDVDDLVSAGTLGLMEAVRRFNSGKQVKIETYARYRIRGAILDALRDLDPASRDLRRKNKQAERVFHELTTRLGRPATDPEMAEALSLTLDGWYQMLQEFRSLGVDWLRPTLMPTLPYLQQDELPATGERDPFELCYLQEQRELLNRALGAISERERLILSLYYEHNFTMKRIARELGIDESRVSQIHSAVLNRLRSKVRSMVQPAPEPAGVAA